MRVLSVINSLGGSGGAEHGLVREVTRFESVDEQLVVRLFEKDHLEEGLRAAGIGVAALGLHGSRAGYNWPLAARRLAGVIRRFRPDVLQSSLFSANLVTQLATRSSRLPVLSTFTLSGDPHLLRAYQPGASSRRASALRALSRFTAQPDHIWFRGLTQDAVDTNCRLLGVDPSRAVTIPRGVPRHNRNEGSKSLGELSLPEDVPLVLNIGRQTAQKGHLHLLRAFARVVKETPAHLAVIGREGDASSQMRQAVSDLGLERDVSLVGYASNASDYLNHASVFAFSSLMEGLGTAVLEAMAAQVPVVCFDIPPVREVTDEGRLVTLVDVGDEAGLADEILRAIHREGAIMDKVEPARSWVDTNYSIDAIARKVENLLHQVAGLG